MKAIVIGGSGFLGSHVADELSRKGIEVTIFDLVESEFIVNEKQRFIKGGIQDAELLESAILGMDFVFVFSSIADIKEAHLNPYRTIEVNVLFLTNVLNICVKCNVKRVIYSSSIYVYSNNGSFYKASKQCAEILIETFNEEYGMNYSIIRYGSLYGPRANSFNFIKNAIQEALTTGKISRIGDGSEIRDYIHVVDAAVATVNQVDNPNSKDYIMITGNQTMRVKDLLEMLKEMLRNEINIEYVSGNLEGHYQITPYFFRPRTAKKVVLSEYHDIGQGLLQSIHEVYNEINIDGQDR
jgi:UDP-glucose 4-epimerase